MKDDYNYMGFITGAIIGLPFATAIVLSSLRENNETKSKLTDRAQASYNIQVEDFNTDGLKDILIKDNKKRIIYFQQKDGTYRTMRNVEDETPENNNYDPLNPLENPSLNPAIPD